MEEEEDQWLYGYCSRPLLGVIASCSLFHSASALAQLYKWILITEQGGGVAEVTSIGELSIIFLTLFPTPLKGP